MKAYATWILLGLLGLSAEAADALLQVVPTSELTRVFAGNARALPIVWQNAGDATATTEVRMRLLQASSATTVTIGEWPWKKLKVLADQTVTERATLDFPEVKAETRFLVKWFEGTNLVLGTTEVLVYPTNLLLELKTLAGEDQAVGIFDPDGVIKPLLKNIGVEFDDLENTGIADFRGKLAVIGPFATRERMPGDLTERVDKLARKGAGVVWLQPPPRSHDKLLPSFYSVPLGDGAVVVVQSRLVAKLSEDPQAQMNLVHCCRLARAPEPPQLPKSNLQP